MRVLLLVMTVFVSVFAKAQAVFEVETPANVKGFYNIGIGDSAASLSYFGYALWGNGDISKKSVRGELKLVASKDSLAGTALSEDFTGKIAVIYRGTYGYAQKALNAQNAGAIAVVILNHGIQQSGAPKLDEVFDMSGALSGENPSTATGLKVNIPVVMISANDRDKLVAEIKNGSTIIANIGKKNTLDYDLSINTTLILPMYKTRPLSLTKAGMVHDTLGVVVYNKGAKNMYDILGVLDVRKDGGNSLYADTIYIDSMEAPGVDKRDTLYLTFKPFKNTEDLTVGKYQVTYSFINLKDKNAGVDTVLIDQYNMDNTASGFFFVTDSINSAGYITSYTTVKSNVGDTVNYVNQPYWSTALYAGPIKEAFKACTVFENDHSKGLQISGVDFLAYSFDQNTAGDYLLNKKFGIEVFQWSPSIASIFDANFGIKTDDLISLHTGEYTFDKKYKSHYGNYNLPTNAIELQDDARYLVCVSTTDTIIGFGFDQTFDNKWTSYYNNRMLSPVYVDGKYYSSGFGFDATSAVSLRISAVEDKSSVNEVALNTVKVTPNPSTGKFNVIAAQGSIEVVVTDMAGKVVYNYSNKNQTSMTHTFDISNVETGVYVAKIVNNGETSVVKLQVAK